MATTESTVKDPFTKEDCRRVAFLFAKRHFLAGLKKALPYNFICTMAITRSKTLWSTAASAQPAGRLPLDCGVSSSEETTEQRLPCGPGCATVPALDSSNWTKERTRQAQRTFLLTKNSGAVKPAPHDGRPQ
jgi:hypothetical protein